MMLCRSFCKLQPSMSSVLRGSLLYLLASAAIGCSSYPTVHGTWVGKVEARTFYSDGDEKQCSVAMIHAMNGPNLPIDVGYNLFLMDKDSHLIDAATFGPNQYVRVTGDAGLAGPRDSKEQIVNSVKGGFGAAESTIRASEIVDAKSGTVIEPQLAVAKIGPTTRP